MYVYLLELDATTITFGFEMTVLYLTRRSANVYCWAVNDLRIMLNPSLITIDIFYVVPPLISSYFLFA